MPWASSRSSAEARGEPLAHVLEEGDGRVRVALGPRPRQADLERQRHQVLLRAVVQVALDAPARRVGGLDDPRLRCAQLLHARALDLVAAQRLLVGAPLGDVEDRAVHPLLAAGALHAVAAIEDPAQLAVGALDAVLEVERLPVVDRVLGLLEHRVAVLGADDAHDRAPRVGAEEVARRVARDPLDLVADELERVVGVPRRAVDRAGHVGHERAQQRLAGVAVGEGALAAAGHRSVAREREPRAEGEQAGAGDPLEPRLHARAPQPPAARSTPATSAQNHSA